MPKEVNMYLFQDRDLCIGVHVGISDKYKIVSKPGYVSTAILGI